MLVHLCVCLCICRIDVSERYMWDFDLFNFIITNTNQGYQHNTRGVLVVGGYPSTQMSIIFDIFRVLL